MWLNLNACALREFSDIFPFRLSIPLLISGSYLPATFSEVFTEFLHLQNNLSYLCSGAENLSKIFQELYSAFSQWLTISLKPFDKLSPEAFVSRMLIVSLQTSCIYVLLFLRKSAENCTEEFAAEFATLLNENHLVSHCMVSIHF